MDPITLTIQPVVLGSEGRWVVSIKRLRQEGWGGPNPAVIQTTPTGRFSGTIRAEWTGAPGTPICGMEE